MSAAMRRQLRSCSFLPLATLPPIDELVHEVEPYPALGFWSLESFGRSCDNELITLEFWEF